MFLESKSSLISDLNYVQKLALQLEEESGKKISRLGIMYLKDKWLHLHAFV